MAVTIPGLTLSILRQDTSTQAGRPVLISGRFTAFGLGFPAMIRVYLEGPSYNPEATHFDAFASPFSGDYSVSVVAQKDGEYKVYSQAFPIPLLPTGPAFPEPLLLLPPIAESPQPPLVVGAPAAGGVNAQLPTGTQFLASPVQTPIEVSVGAPGVSIVMPGAAAPTYGYIPAAPALPYAAPPGAYVPPTPAPPAAPEVPTYPYYPTVPEVPTVPTVPTVPAAAPTAPTFPTSPNASMLGAPVSYMPSQLTVEDIWTGYVEVPTRVPSDLQSALNQFYQAVQVYTGGQTIQMPQLPTYSFRLALDLEDPQTGIRHEMVTTSVSAQLGQSLQLPVQVGTAQFPDGYTPPKNETSRYNVYLRVMDQAGNVLWDNIVGRLYLGPLGIPKAPTPAITAPTANMFQQPTLNAPTSVNYGETWSGNISVPTLWPAGLTIPVSLPSLPVNAVMQLQTPTGETFDVTSLNPSFIPGQPISIPFSFNTGLLPEAGNQNILLTLRDQAGNVLRVFSLGLLSVLAAAKVPTPTPAGAGLIRLVVIRHDSADLGVPASVKVGDTCELHAFGQLPSTVPGPIGAAATAVLATATQMTATVTKPDGTTQVGIYKMTTKQAPGEELRFSIMNIRVDQPGTWTAVIKYSTVEGVELASWGPSAIIQAVAAVVPTASISRVVIRYGNSDLGVPASLNIGDSCELHAFGRLAATSPAARTQMTATVTRPDGTTLVRTYQMTTMQDPGQELRFPIINIPVNQAGTWSAVVDYATITGVSLASWGPQTIIQVAAAGVPTATITRVVIRYGNSDLGVPATLKVGDSCELHAFGLMARASPAARTKMTATITRPDKTTFVGTYQMTTLQGPGEELRFPIINIPVNQAGNWSADIQYATDTGILLGKWGPASIIQVAAAPAPTASITKVVVRYGSSDLSVPATLKVGDSCELHAFGLLASTSPATKTRMTATIVRPDKTSLSGSYQMTTPQNPGQELRFSIVNIPVNQTGAWIATVEYFTVEGVKLASWGPQTIIQVAAAAPPVVAPATVNILNSPVAGQALRFSFSGFQPNATIYFSGLGISGSVTSDRNGAGSVSQTVSADTPAGSHALVVRDTYGHQVTTSFTVQAAAAAAPKLTALNSPVSGGALQYSFSGFQPNAAVNVWVQGGGGVTNTADSKGAGTFSFIDGDPPGNYTLIAQDNYGHRATAPFTVR